MHTQDQIAGEPTGRVSMNHRQMLIMALLSVALLLIPIMLPAADEAGAFTVTEIRTEKGDDSFLLNARMDINLNTGPKEALENGIPLVFEFQIQTLEKHIWLWDIVVAEYKQVRQVQLHALSRTYLVKDLDTGAQRSYLKLDDALQAAGFLHNFPVLDYGLMQEDQSYSVRLRGNLDIEALPTPVRLLAYVSSAWDMDSEWYQWQLVR
jgi:Domain of unknown function (DUF4390)